jgi:DNA-directed RNA polymerase subunit K/omega
LEETAKQAEKALEELKQRTTDINRERKNSQVGFMLISRATLVFISVVIQDTNRKPVDIAGEKVDRVDIKHPPD